MVRLRWKPNFATESNIDLFNYGFGDLYGRLHGTLRKDVEDRLTSDDFLERFHVFLPDDAVEGGPEFRLFKIPPS